MGNHTSASRRGSSRGKSGYHKTAVDMPNFHQGAAPSGSGGGLTMDQHARAVLLEATEHAFTATDNPGDETLVERDVARFAGGGAPGVSVNGRAVYNNSPLAGDAAYGVEFETVGHAPDGSETFSQVTSLMPVESLDLGGSASFEDAESGTSYNIHIEDLAWGSHTREGLAAFSRTVYMAIDRGATYITMNPADTADMWKALGFDGPADTFETEHYGSDDMEALRGALAEHGLPWPPA